MKRRALIVVLIVLGLAGAGFLVAQLFESVEERVPVGYSGEARRNPLFACQRLFERMGLSTHSVPYLGAPPPEDHVLVLRNTGRYLGPPAIERLIEWVEQGGNLILLFPSDSALLEDIEDELVEGRFELPIASELGVQCILDDEGEGLLEVDLGHGSLWLSLPGRFAFEDALGQAEIAVEEPLRARLLSFVRGLGRVTLVADDRWASNDDIGEHDHARALWQLANIEGARAGATIVFSEAPPGLLLLVFEHGWMVIASLALFLAVWLWRIGSRFGPLLADPPRDRRDFSEHVVAASEFLWRNGASSTLLAAPRQEIRRQIGLRRPDLAELEPQQLAARLAAAANLPQQRVERALELAATRNESEFTQIVRDLESVRRAL